MRNREQRAKGCRKSVLDFQSMDSPKSDPNTTPSLAAFQDSSLFNYLSTLSPIKTLKQAQLGQSLSLINCPPPPPVFTSPRINPKRETSFLKRPQYVNSSAAELSSEYNDEGKILAASPDVCQPYATQSSIQLIRCAQKECGNKGFGQVHPCSPIGSLDEFLSDSLEGCVNSTDSPDLRSQKATDPAREIQSTCSIPKETILESVVGVNDDCNDVRNATENVAAAIITSSEDVQKDPQDQNSLDHVEPLQTEGVKWVGAAEQKNGGKPTNERLNSVSKSVNDSIEADLRTGYASVKQDNHLLVNQAAMDFASDLSSNKDDDIAESENEMPVYSSSLQHNETQDVMPRPAESGQQDELSCNQQWMHESLQIVLVDSINNENFGAPSVGTVENQISNDYEEANQHQRGMRRRLQFEADEARRKSIGNSSSWNSLNIVPSARAPASPMDSDASNKVVNSHHALSRLPLCPLETSATHIDKNSGISSMASSMPSGIGLHLNSIGNTVAVSCGLNTQLTGKDYLNVSGEEFFSGSNCPISRDLRGWLVPFERQRLASLDACRLKEFSQTSPKKKRKRDPNTIENESCKRCNCKKSKCLKLYCDCFAAGVYCAEPCTCVECFNKPEYEDTVLGARQQIESRNPLAFAPKIVRRATESPQNSEEDSNRKTPASARHKRGCNCKKSKCLKKYCECYQAGVGCSDGCRCEGCKNVFGKKEELENVKVGDERWEDISEGKMGIDILPLDQRHSDISPLFQFSNHGIDIPKSRHPTRRHIGSSPESEISFLSPYGKSPQSPRTSDRNYSLTKLRGNAGLVLHDQKLDYQIAGKVYPFSPSWDGLPERYDLTPLLQHSQSRAPASVASDKVYCSKASQELYEESGNSSAGSLRWRHSPVTPNAHFDGSKFVTDPHSGKSLYNCAEDETPHILKESHSSMKIVKTSSPNQKRVSPPHTSLNDLMSSSSPGLRSGRKFILQSVPSFPPLTPYCEPKGTEK